MAKLTPEVRENFIDSVKELKMTQSELAKLFGVSKTTIKQWIKKLGLLEHVKDGRTGLSIFNKSKRNLGIYEMYWKTNRTYAEIGTVYGMTRQRVCAIVKVMEKHRINGQL